MTAPPPGDPAHVPAAAAPAAAAPVLAYDDLPPHSGITHQRDPDGRVMIEVPGEPYGALIRRMLRLPRFWAFLVLIWLGQNWLTLWQAHRAGVTLMSSRFWPMLIVQGIALPIGMAVGMVLVSRRWARINIDAGAVTQIRGGLILQQTKAWERQRVCDVRSNGTAVILTVARPAGSWLRKPRKVPLLGGRDAGELAWIARAMRDALALPRPAPEPVIPLPQHDPRLPPPTRTN